MKKYDIALYPGDGIGIEVMTEAKKVLNTVADKFGFSLNITEFPWGHRFWKEHGKVVPDDFLSILKDYPVILLGAIGDPANVPDHITLAPLIEMRQKFDQYACVRPAKLFPGVRSPLADRKAGDIDLIVIRENSEGEYVDAGGFFKSKTTDGMAIQTAIHTRKGVERIIRYGFETARKRKEKHHWSHWEKSPRNHTPHPQPKTQVLQLYPVIYQQYHHTSRQVLFLSHILLFPL